MALYYKTKRSYDHKKNGQKFENPSDTIPGESDSIHDLLVKHSQGMQIQRKKVSYFDEEDLEKINRFYAPGLDIIDLEELSEHVQSLQESVEKAKDRKQADEQKRDESGKFADESISPGESTSDSGEAAKTDSEGNKE